MLPLFLFFSKFLSLSFLNDWTYSWDKESSKCIAALKVIFTDKPSSLHLNWCFMIILNNQIHTRALIHLNGSVQNSNLFYTLWNIIPSVLKQMSPILIELESYHCVVRNTFISLEVISSHDTSKCFFICFPYKADKWLQWWHKFSNVILFSLCWINNDNWNIGKLKVLHRTFCFLWGKIERMPRVTFENLELLWNRLR